jgi:uncharacterized peroxidase-related enzyme
METGMTDNTQASNVDIIDQLLGIEQHSEIWTIRHAREKVAAATQASYDGYFANSLSQLNLPQRLEIAALCSELTPCPLLAQHYTKQLAQAKNQPHVSGVNEVAMAAAKEFARVLTIKPIDGDKVLLHTLPKTGLDTPTIVALAQLIAFVSFQTRVLQGLIAMRQATENQIALHTNAVKESLNNPPSNATSNATSNAALGSPIRIKGFTNEELNWKSWLDILKLESATEEQLIVLKESHPKATLSDYYLTLVHQPEILKQRSIAFNAIMYAPGGLSRADRELGATVVSRINGCVYCASVHAQRFEQLGKRNDAITQVFEDPYRITTNLRDKAISDFSIQLTLEPNKVNATSVHALTEVGMNMGEVLDLMYSIAIFAWANRLMLNLGEPVFQITAN